MSFTANSILNALAEPVLVLDGDLRPVVANAAFYKTLRLSPALLNGKSVQEVIVEDGEDARNLKAVLESVAVHENGEGHVEIDCAVPEDEKKRLSLTARRLQVSDGPAEYILVEMHDITRQEEANRKIVSLNVALQRHAVELQETNQELEAFTQSASHDLRAPLRFMDKIAHQLIQEHGPELPAGAAEKIQMIKDSARDMGRLIEDLIAFARARHELVKSTRVGMRRLAHEVIGEMGHETEGRDIAVDVEALPPCRGDRALLKQVLRNLLSNAFKFTRPCEHAEIRVGSVQSGSTTAYFVRDNGVGIGKKNAADMFIPFHRLHRNVGFEGSGLGLALVQRIVRRHGGRVWAESGPVEGMSIYFTLNEKTAGD